MRPSSQSRSPSGDGVAAMAGAAFDAPPELSLARAIFGLIG
jgi:hypothetical protein